MISIDKYLSEFQSFLDLYFSNNYYYICYEPIPDLCPDLKLAGPV